MGGCWACGCAVYQLQKLVEVGRMGVLPSWGQKISRHQDTWELLREDSVGACRKTRFPTLYAVKDTHRRSHVRGLFGCGFEHTPSSAYGIRGTGARKTDHTDKNSESVVVPCLWCAKLSPESVHVGGFSGNGFKLPDMNIHGVRWAGVHEGPMP